MANNILAGVPVVLKVAFTTTDPFSAAPSYTDISAYVSRAAGDFDPATYGGSDIAGAAEPGSLLIPLKNQDGRFDPSNASAPSPMLGNLVIDRCVAWQVGGVTRFDGYVESWTPGDDIDGKAICWLKAVCPQGLLARHQLQGIGLADYVLKIAATPPTSYFRLGDKDGIELFDEVTQRSRGQYHDRRNRTSGLAISDPDGAADLYIPSSSFLGVHADVAPTGSGAFAVSVLINDLILPTAGTAHTVWELGSLIFYVTDTGGATALIGPGISIAGPAITAGMPTVLTVRRASNGTSYTIGKQDGVQTPQQTAAGSGSGYTIPAGTPLYVGGGPSAGGPDLSGSADELMVWRSVDPGDSVLSAISNRMIWGWPNERASIRSATSARQAGFPAARHVALNVDTQLDTPLDGSDLPSGDLLSDQQKLATTVGGDFFSRPDGNLYHQGYRLPALSPTPDLIFDDAVGTSQLRYSTFEGLVPFTDRQTSVTASDGTNVGVARSADASNATAPLSLSIYRRSSGLSGDQHAAIAAVRRLRRLATTATRIKF
ncbi:MAG: hypothetical protein QOD63_2512, partial [Actinomycetota bacterium]|nr:hypothetical protein [Actinomycetota bacterium]